MSAKKLTARMVLVVLDPIPLGEMQTLVDRVQQLFDVPASELFMDPATAKAMGVRFAFRPMANEGTTG